MFLNRKFHFSSQKIGIFYIIMALSLAFSMQFIHNRVAKKLTQIKQIKYALLFMSTILMMLAAKSIFYEKNFFFSQLITWIICIIFYMILPFITLNTTALFSNLTSNTEQGKLMGGLGAVNSLGLALSALAISFTGFVTEYVIQVIAAIFLFLSYKLLVIPKSIKGEV